MSGLLTSDENPDYYQVRQMVLMNPSVSTHKQKTDLSVTLYLSVLVTLALVTGPMCGDELVSVCTSLSHSVSPQSPGDTRQANRDSHTVCATSSSKKGRSICKQKVALMKCFSLIINTILANTVLARIDGPSNRQSLTSRESLFPTCANVRSIEGRKRLCNDVQDCKTVCDKNECTTKYEYREKQFLT